MRSVAPDVPLRFLYTCDPDEDLGAILARLGIHAESIPLRPISNHVVLPCGPNVLILKPPPVSVRVSSDVVSRLRSLSADAVLLNSTKDIFIALHFAEEAARHRTRLYAVLTPSLPADYLIDAVLPWASVAVLSSVEAGSTLGTDVGADFASMVGLMHWMGSRAHYAGCLFLTLGQDGMLAAGAPFDDVYHVGLRKPAARAVSAVVRRRPGSVCGCGDAAAGGIFAYLETGRSALGGSIDGLPECVAAAMAGSASAIKHLGYMRRLSPNDFDVRGPFSAPFLAMGAAAWAL